MRVFSSVQELLNAVMEGFEGEHDKIMHEVSEGLDAYMATANPALDKLGKTLKGATQIAWLEGYRKGVLDQIRWCAENPRHSQKEDV